jgi:hypothetical protein
VTDVGDGGSDGVRADLEPVGPPGQQRLVVHPHERALELVGHLGGRGGCRDHVPARDIHLVGQHKGDGVSGLGLGQVAFTRDDAQDRALAPRGLHADALAHGQAPARQRAGKAPEIEVRTVHPLHRKAQRGVVRARAVHRHRLEPAHERGALVPGHGRAWGGDVVALEGRHRHEGDALEAQALRPKRARQGGRKATVVFHDTVVHGAGVVHQVHLVDGHEHVPDTEQVHERAVAACLREHALARVHHEHGGVCRGSAGDHVARVLLVARRVGHDELAPLGGEEAVGHIDRDALLALGGQAIDEQGEVQRLALRAPLARVGVQGGQVVFEEQLALEQQPPDKRALAVVHAAAGDEAQQPLVLVGVQVAFDVGGDERRGVGHQKYPSCFFFSIEAAASWSITRPARSEVRVRSISWMMAGSVSASDSVAPVSG